MVIVAVAAAAAAAAAVENMREHYWVVADICRWGMTMTLLTVILRMLAKNTDVNNHDDVDG